MFDLRPFTTAVLQAQAVIRASCTATGDAPVIAILRGGVTAGRD